MANPRRQQDSQVVALREGLMRAGARLTPQRLEIYRELAASRVHPDADSIYRRVRRRLPAISLDTVYRTMWLLLEAGMLTTLGPSRQRARFDANMSSHHHFVCTSCRMVRDFYNSRFDHLDVTPSVKSLGRIQSTQVEVRGVCSECMKKSSRKKTP